MRVAFTHRPFLVGGFMGIWKKSPKHQSPLVLLRAFSKGLSSITPLKDLLKRLLKTLLEIAEAPGGSIWLIEAEALALREAVGGEPLQLEFKSSDPFVNYLGQTRCVLSRDQLFKDPQFIDIRDSGVKFLTSVHGEWIFPLCVEQRYLGALVLSPRIDGRSYSPELREFLEVLTTMGAIAVDNALHYDSLAKQNLKLSEIAKLKTDFVSTISHELSTPLNGILGLTEVLLNPETGGPLNDDQRRYLQMIQSAGEELSEIVSQVLNLTRFQSQHGSLEVKRVELHKVAEDLVRDLDGVLGEKGMVLRMDLAKKQSVYGDEGQIRQLLQNLLENAVKFSDGHPGGEIILQAQKQGEMLQVCVSDSGIGIAERDQEIIFEDFRQAQGGVERSYGGTGLGLAVAKKIVELHGGRIWVESKQGEGSHFYFTLPLKPGLVQAREIQQL
jgi:signal transduction histidine kinase